MFFTLTDRASTIPSVIRRENNRGISTKLQREYGKQKCSRWSLFVKNPRLLLLGVYHSSVSETLFQNLQNRHHQGLVLLCVCVRVCVCVFFSSDYPIGLEPYPVTCAVASPVRGLLDMKISEEHQRDMNTKTKQKRLL